ncbi:OBG-type G domain-containing protein, partial [Haematococcus lacustris]
VIAVCKSADLLLMVLDATKPWTHRDILTRELESVGMRLNKSPPNVYFRKRKTGGLSINSTIQLTQLDDKMIARILQVDMASIEEVDEIAHRPNSVPISCSMNLNMDGLLCAIWDAMALVRCYTKKVGAKPDFGDPVVMTQDRGGTTVEALCRQMWADA